MNVIAISNQKGGVGKTTTAWMLARLLKESGRSVLLIDLDPQANLTKLSGIVPNGHNISDVLGGAVPPTATLRSAARTTDGGIDVVPSKLDDLENAASGLTLRGLDPVKAMRNPPVKALAGALAKEGFRWDYVLIDCPPSAGILTINALMAADLVIVPTQPEPLSIEGCAQMLDVLAQVGEAKGAVIPHAVLPTMVAMYTVTHREGMRLLEDRYGVKGFIPARRGQDADAELLAAYASVADMVMSVEVRHGS